MARGDDKKYADHPKEQEADRYRKAAEDALQQLDWVIGSLHTSFRLSEKEQTKRFLERIERGEERRLVIGRGAERSPR